MTFDTLKTLALEFYATNKRGVIAGLIVGFALGAVLA